MSIKNTIDYVKTLSWHDITFTVLSNGTVYPNYLDPESEQGILESIANFKILIDKNHKDFSVCDLKFGGYVVELSGSQVFFVSELGESIEAFKEGVAAIISDLNNPVIVESIKS